MDDMGLVNLFFDRMLELSVVGLDGKPKTGKELFRLVRLGERVLY